MNLIDDLMFCAVRVKNIIRNIICNFLSHQPMFIFYNLFQVRITQVVVQEGGTAQP